jgi:DNA-binding NtrC family response regulator
MAEVALTSVTDVDKALEQAYELLEIAHETGSDSAIFGALTNLGHLSLAKGNLKAADDALKKGLLRNTFGGGPEVALRDTMMSLYLCSDMLDKVEEQASAIERLLDDTGTRESFHGLWYLVTRIRWLYRTGDIETGLALALDAIPRIERMADRNLLERMKLLIAEGLGRVGRNPEGAKVMAEAVEANPDPPLEMIAEVYRVAGCLTAGENTNVATANFNRAIRILDGIGLVTSRNEAIRDAKTLGSQTLTANGFQSPLSEAHVARADLSLSEALSTERIALLLELAAHPPLLASEALSLIAGTQCTRAATIIATDKHNSIESISAFATPGAPSPLAPGQEVVRIAIGEYRDRTYDLLVVPKPSASARATLLAVDRLVHAAVALAHVRLQERERAALWPEPSPEQQLGLVCAAESMLDLVKTARRIAPSNVTVLITGETGTGKELFARALHQASPRHDRVFLPFNCTTVPKDVLDSQLFGYRRGAFTGAVDDSPGLIRAAAGGTLFLDEIGEMSPDVQPKLLRFLESGEILPIGESRPVHVDVRIVAATNANLDKLVAAGKFREDLYYRLNVIRLRVPPLRERREEVPLLVDYFLERFSSELQKPQLRIAEETLEYLALYQWPGNVRQLANEIRRMAALSEAGAELMPEHLSAEIAASRRTIPASARTLEPTEVVVRIDQPAAAAIEHLERALVTRALRTTRGNTEEAAKILGLSRKGLYLKRLRFGIE